MRRHRKALAAAVAAALLVVLLASGALPDLPAPEKVIEDLAEALGPWTYALVGAAAFLETGAFVGLVAPGETTVIVGGVIAGQGEVSLLPLIGLVWVCSVLGDCASFFLGRHLGRGFLLRHGPKVKIDEQRLHRVESYFERHGGKTILIGRFIGLVRALSPFVAGSSGLAFRRFLPFSVIGCGLWGTIFSVLGYLFWRSFDKVAAVAGQATLAFGALVVVVVGGVYAYRRLRKPEQRRRLAAWLERQGRKPLLRPAFAVGRSVRRRVVAPVTALAAPRLRFLAQRLTPGDLGLELTTAAAAAGIGLYVFVVYANSLSGGATTSPADRGLLDLADDLRSAPAVDVLKIVTDLGALPTVSTLVVGVGVLLVVRRRFSELAALVAGALAVFAAVQLAKAGIDRPRPTMPLDVAAGSSFPSGHAAYSTIWVGAAVVLARVVPGLARDAGLVTIGFVVAVVVGLSRIYLRVHYWSDVAGGWGLGAAVLGACAVTTLVVGHLRQNEDPA